MKNDAHRMISIATALIVALLVSVIPTATAQAATSSLESELLSTTTIESVVGGPVVDKIYAIEVASGTVLIASLRGEVSGEMGLYLFSPDATSLFIDTPIATAAKPGGTQVISVPIVFGGTYYLNVNGRNVDRAYKFKLTVSKQRDATAPVVVSATMNPRVQSTTVCPVVKASDTLSGVSAISVSRLGSAGEPEWQPYIGQRPYCLLGAAPAGTLKVLVKVRNGVGLVSKAQLLSSFVDDTPPRVLKMTPAQGGNLLVERPKVTWVFSEPVNLQVGASDPVWVSNQAGQRIVGQAVVARDRKSLVWQPSKPIAVGTVLLLSLASFSDDAGNLKELPDTLIVSRRGVPTIAIKSVKKIGIRLRLAVQVSTSLAGKTLTLQQLVSGSWQDLQEVSVGKTSFIQDIDRLGTAIRITYAGDELIAPYVGKAFKLP